MFFRDNVRGFFSVIGVDRIHGGVSYFVTYYFGVVGGDFDSFFISSDCCCFYAFYDGRFYKVAARAKY